ncbi:T-cell immunomodulatory protein, partial [Tachysurus ichikawai]
WIPVLTDFQRKDSLWGFVPPPDAPQPGEFHPSITLHLGDYNLDGFPDALVILKNTSNRSETRD